MNTKTIRKRNNTHNTDVLIHKLFYLIVSFCCYNAVEKCSTFEDVLPQEVFVGFKPL